MNLIPSINLTTVTTFQQTFTGIIIGALPTSMLHWALRLEILWWHLVFHEAILHVLENKKQQSFK